MLGVILAGGKGSRLGEGAPPKPLVEIAGTPLVFHVADQLAQAGATRILVATGHRGAEVAARIRQRPGLEPIDTGADTPNGGRLLALADRLGHDPFLMAWCDGITNADLAQLDVQRRKSDALMALLAVHPPERFGRLEISGDQVSAFSEKGRDETRWVNGGYFAVDPAVLRDLTLTSSIELDLLPALARKGRLAALRHNGFWACVDTLSEAEGLNALLQSNAELTMELG